MNKRLTTRIAVIFTLCIAPLAYGNSHSTLVGCWQEMDNSTSSVCYQANGAFYINQSTYTVHGTWSSNGNNIAIDTGGLKLNIETLTLSDREHKYKSLHNGKIFTAKKVATQAPLTPKARVSKQVKDVAGDIADMVTAKKSKMFGQINHDLVVKSPHCKNQNNNVIQEHISATLDAKSVTDATSLVTQVFGLICQATQNSADSKVKTESSFMTDVSFYSGAKKLGNWPCPITEGSTKSNEISFFGIFPTANQVSRWTVTNNHEVNVWLAPFLTGPSDSNLLNMVFDDNRWQLRSVCYSSRL